MLQPDHEGTPSSALIARVHAAPGTTSLDGEGEQHDCLSTTQLRTLADRLLSLPCFRFPCLVIGSVSFCQSVLLFVWVSVCLCPASGFRALSSVLCLFASLSSCLFGFLPFSVCLCLFVCVCQSLCLSTLCMPLPPFCLSVCLVYLPLSANQLAIYLWHIVTDQFQSTTR